MNILVTGANGQLGNEIRIITKNSNDNYIYSDISTSEYGETFVLDITNPENVKKAIVDNKIDIIINCAAYTNVDKAEEEQDACYKLNATAVEILANAIHEVNGWLIHISTDYVFGGDSYNYPCNEAQQGMPTGIYGATKLSGERFIEKSGCNYIIIRTSWLYSEFGKNFVKTMLNLTETKESLKVVFDQVGTPTYAFDLAKVIADIVEQRKFINNSGIYHYSNEGVCSWYDFTKMISNINGNTKCIIYPCHSDEFPSKVKRPAYSVLDKTKIKKTFGITIPYWYDSLKICINNLKDNL